MIAGRRRGTAAEDGSPAEARRPRRVWPWWALGALALGVLLGAVAWVGIRGLLAKAELDEAVPIAGRVAELVAAGDATGAAAAAGALERHASEAAALTSDPVWRVGELTPVIGDQLEAVRLLTSAVEITARDAVRPLVDATGGLDFAAFAPSDGRIDLEALVALQGPAHEASVALAEARKTLDADALASPALLPPILEARDELVARVDEAADAVDALDRAVHVLPPMLGADGPRDILLLFQNNAELRSTGGIPGALALVHADGGALTLVQQAAAADFGIFRPPVVELPQETRGLFSDAPAEWFHDVNYLPSFSRAAALAREMWATRGVAPDTVVALDPVVLAGLLRAVGPVALPSGDMLTADNAVHLLLSDVYARYEDPVEQNRFFAMASSAMFQALLSGTADPGELIGAFATAGDERRVLVWNVDPTVQSQLEGTTIAGDLPTSTAERQAFGVYLNDHTGSKMDVYLDVGIAAGSMVCRNDGRAEYAIEVTLANTAPADAAVSLPGYVTGGGANGTPAGSIRTSVMVYGTPGSYNLGVTDAVGAAVGYQPATDTGYTLSRVFALLAPGESVTRRFHFLGGEPGEREIRVESTPLVGATKIADLPISCDDAIQ